MTLPEAKELLGLDDDYTLQEAKSARNRLAKRYHPDVNNSPQAEETLKQINEAYQLLVDSYDAEQARMRERRAAVEEQERRKKAAEEERVRREAEQDRARQAAERKQREQQQRHEDDWRTADRKWAAEQEWYGSQEWADEQARNEEREWRAQQEWYAQQEWQRQEDERQWKRRTEEAERDRAEQSRRQRERWEAAQRRERERQEAIRHKEEHRERDRSYQEACRAAQKAESAEEHERVASLFEGLGDYLDSQTQCVSHRDIAAEIRAKHQERKKRAVPINILSILPTGLSALCHIILSFRIGPGGFILTLTWIIPIMFIAVLHLGLVVNIDNMKAPLDLEGLKYAGGFLLAIAFCTYSIAHSQAMLLAVAAEFVSLLGCLFGCEDEGDLIKRVPLSCLAWILLIAAIIHPG